MRDTLLVQLATPTGLPGSGRLRYGAAMALHRDGALSDTALEVYRICSALDRQDPAPLLRERGLPPPDLPPLSAEAAIRLLVAEADRYLSAHQGPGVAEVRAGLNAARSGPVTAAAPRPNPVVSAHLAPALALLEPDQPALSMAIAAAAPHLAWGPYDSYPRAEIGEAFATGHAFASVIGDGAAIPAQDYDFGLFLIAPHVLYRDHAHAAPELYAPLTGPHGWRFGPGMPLVVKPAHQPIWNDPQRPHLTKVGPNPFLCLFAWTRDTLAPARVLPADDWRDLEALRLDP